MRRAIRRHGRSSPSSCAGRAGTARNCAARSSSTPSTGRRCGRPTAPFSRCSISCCGSWRRSRRLAGWFVRTSSNPASPCWRPGGGCTLARATTGGGGMGEVRALRHAGWAGAASIVLLVAGIALCSLVGVDEPSISNAAILDRLDDRARQGAAGLGLPLLAAGVALLLWFAVGLRSVLDRLSGDDPLAHVI